LDIFWPSPAWLWPWVHPELKPFILARGKMDILKLKCFLIGNDLTKGREGRE